MSDLLAGLKRLNRYVADPFTYEQRMILKCFGRHDNCPTSYWIEGEGPDVVWVQRQRDWRPEQWLHRGRPCLDKDDHLLADLNYANRRFGADNVRAAFLRALEVYEVD